MSVRAKTAENQDAIDILLARYDDDLTAWEHDFLESLGNQERLSERQVELLDELFARVAGMR